MLLTRKILRFSSKTNHFCIYISRVFQYPMACQTEIQILFPAPDAPADIDPTNTFGGSSFRAQLEKKNKMILICLWITNIWICRHCTEATFAKCKTIGTHSNAQVSVIQVSIKNSFCLAVGNPAQCETEPPRPPYLQTLSMLHSLRKPWQWYIGVSKVTCPTFLHHCTSTPTEGPWMPVWNPGHLVPRFTIIMSVPLVGEWNSGQGTATSKTSESKAQQARQRKGVSRLYIRAFRKRKNPSIISQKATINLI